MRRTNSLTETLSRLRNSAPPHLLVIHPLSGRSDGIEIEEILAAAQDSAREHDRALPAVVVCLDALPAATPQIETGIDDVVFGALDAREWQTRTRLWTQRAQRFGRLQQELERSERERSTDFKTGLANDRSFADRFRQEFERSRRYRIPLSLILLDIDDFKSINERHDHSFGDRVLEVVGRRLRDALRQSDVPGRVGGDELALLLPQTDLAEAARLADRLRLQLSSVPIGDDRYSTVVTVSMGVDSLRDSDGTEQDLRRRANLAMLKAKRRGKNTIALFDQEDQAPGSSERPN